LKTSTHANARLEVSREAVEGRATPGEGMEKRLDSGGSGE
jgi:hypothetical protein